MDDLNLPWRYDYEPGYCGELIAANGSVICTFTDEPLPKDAAHIVRCVNAHEGLVEALQKLAFLGNGDQYGNSDGNCIAIAALAKAQGDQDGTR